MEEYKSNSHASKEKEKNGEEKKVEKIISGNARAKKKSEFSKFADVFVSEDAGNVKSYILMEVLVPAVKKAVYDIILDNRGEAEEVLLRMDEIVATYGTVSVADLYDLVGITGAYTDNKYGWTDIRSASVVRVRDGYMIKLPRALPLN